MFMLVIDIIITVMFVIIIIFIYCLLIVTITITSATTSMTTSSYYYAKSDFERFVYCFRARPSAPTHIVSDPFSKGFLSRTLLVEDFCLGPF